MKVLKKLYDKSKIIFAITWIVAYCVLLSVGDSLSELVGIQKSVTLAVGALLSFILFLFISKNGLLREYGLCKSETSPKVMLFYCPVIVMMGANLFYGVKLNFGIAETILYVLSMLFVGFLEEVIFRGLLFNAMRKDNFSAAVIVSSVTFGIGHIINLVNGSGAEIIPNILQIIYATSAGFMFVMMYCKEKSLIACIASHGIFNAISVFVNESNITVESQILSCAFLTVVTGGYAVYLAILLRKSNSLK